jgi:HD-GYP domain-containing protein (c-di-GMP phosphodiesterase class II)
MTEAASEAPVRMAELLGALSLGIDLGFGQPMEHVLRQCRIALQICALAGFDEPVRASVYYSALLVNVACHSDAYEQAQWFGDDIALKATKYDHEPYTLAEAAMMLRLLGSGGTPLHRVRTAIDFAVSGRHMLDGLIARHARLARTLGEQLGLGEMVADALGGSYERWDGRGFPGNLVGTAIPVASRVVQLAEFLEVAHRTGGTMAAIDVAERRSGKQFDPSLVALVVADVEKVFAEIDDTGSWDAVIAGEPSLTARLSPLECEEALAAVARFVDLKSPYTLGHSQAVADLAAAAAAQLGASAAEARAVRLAGLVSGFGRLGVSNAILDKRGPLNAGEWERVRLQPHFTERMLHRSEALDRFGRIAVQHRERLDGSGYPRGLTGSALSPSGLILGAADAYQSMLEPRPHRAALAAGEAAAELRVEARAGRMHAPTVDAVLHVAGHRPSPRRQGPAGLTMREVEVLTLLARGLSNKQIGARIGITAKTAGNHIEHIYTKIGGNSRADACLFAMRNGMLPELGGR